MVAATFASARVITLRAPVDGIVNVALAGETEVVRADGSTAAFGDIAPGAGVEVAGRPSAADTILARRIVLLS